MEQKTFCRICDVCCGMIATVENGTITRLRPNPEHVVSKGYACAKGRAYREIVHSPDRVRQPLRRHGSVARTDAFQSASWDEAITDIGARLKTIIAESGPDSVALYVGNGAGFAFLHPFWAQGFLTGIGSSSLYGSATQDCSNKFAAAREMYGFPMLQPVPDFENAGCFIMLGGNPAATKLSFRGVPNPTGALRRAAERGCRIYHVNPRRTESADAAGEHLSIRPDTDVFFLLAFAGELLHNGGARREAAALHMKNLGALEAACAPWTPERQSEVTGISADRLREAAAVFRDADGASLYLSTGLNMGRNGTLCAWLVEAVNAFTGNLDRRGGTLVGKGALMDFPALGAKAGAMMSDRTGRIGGFKTVNELFPGSVLADEILTPGKGRIRALLVAAGNPYLTLPDTAKTERALLSLDLLVTVDIVRSATGDFAHWVLPGITPYEHPDIGYIFHSMMGIGHRRFLQYTDAVIKPVGDSRDELWIWQNLCRAAGGRFFGSSILQGFIDLRGRLSLLPGAIGRSFSFSHWKILDGFLKVFGRPGVRRMRKHPDGLLLKEPPPGSFLGKRVRTSDGLVDLAPPSFLAAMDKLDGEFLWEKNNADCLKLVNMRGFRTHNSFLQSSPSLMRGEQGTNHIHLHPDDARLRSVEDGRQVLVWSDSGCIRLPARVSDRMAPGTVAIPFGWGQQRSRGLSVASRTGGANVNWLFPSGVKHTERLGLMAHLSGLPVEVVPVPEGVPVVVAADGGGRVCSRDFLFSLQKAKSLPYLFHLRPDGDPLLNLLLSASRVLDGWFLAVPESPPESGKNLRDILDSLVKAITPDNSRPVIFSDRSRIVPLPGVFHSSMSDRIELFMENRKPDIIDFISSMNPVILPGGHLSADSPDSFRQLGWDPAGK